MLNRRLQQPITIRSDRAAARLRALTRTGRSQAAVIEEALDLMPEPPVASDPTEWLATIAEIQAMYRDEGGLYRSMAEFDAAEYDADGNPR